MRREVWIWRVIAAGACVGWVVSWVSGQRDHAFRREPVPSMRQTSRHSSPLPLVEPSLHLALPSEHPDEEAMEQAREEVRSELRARHDADAERRLYRVLDAAAAFADAHDLGSDKRQTLYAAVREMHEQMVMLGPPDPFEDADPSDGWKEHQEVFDGLDAQLRAAFGDEVTDEFHEWMRPPGPPGPPPFELPP